MQKWDFPQLTCVILCIVPPQEGHFGTAWSVRLSVPWCSCLGYRHTGCLQLSHRRPPQMCEVRTRLWMDVDPLRFLDRTAMEGAIPCWIQQVWQLTAQWSLLCSVSERSGDEYPASKSHATAFTDNRRAANDAVSTAPRHTDTGTTDTNTQAHNLLRCQRWAISSAAQTTTWHFVNLQHQIFNHCKDATIWSTCLCQGTNGMELTARRYPPPKKILRSGLGFFEKKTVF